MVAVPSRHRARQAVPAARSGGSVWPLLLGSSAVLLRGLRAGRQQWCGRREQVFGELALARQQRCTVLKLIHGYGSTGAGGDIRIAVQRRLYEMAQNGQIRACIYGENWSKSNEEAWKLLQQHSDLNHDSDVGRGNRGVTIVLL